MKVNLRIVILLLVCIPLHAKADPCNIPTTEQVSKLAAAVWKEPVHSIDVTLYKEITKPPKSLEEIRAMFERVFEKTDGPKENLSGWKLESFNRNVQLNVERLVKEQEAGRRVKQRIRIDGYRQRIDHVFARPKMVLLEGTAYEEIRPEVVLGPNTPYEMTHVNLGDKRKGDFTSFAYYHVNKSARITNDKRMMWKRNDFIGFAGLASSFQGLLGVNGGTMSEPFFVPDPNKMEKLRKTGFVAGVLRVTIELDPNNPDTRDRIEIKAPDHPAGTVMICDREDYSRVYYMEACNPGTGRALYIRQCSNFDSQGFPNNITIAQYDFDGTLKKKEVYTIEKVELNPSIPNEVFEFRPPEGYEVADLRPGSGYDEKFKRESEALEKLKQLRKVSDIPELKRLLEHESWKVRLLALKTLGQLLRDDFAALKDIAGSMRNDENPVVRKQASNILQRLGSDK